MKTIFLIDDDSDDREIFQTALLSLSSEYNYVEAKDGHEALEMLKNKDFISPDVFFVDLNMPKVGGLEFILAMKEMPRFKDIPAYMYTTSSSLDDKEKCMKAGAGGFIIKHSSYAALCEELKQLLKGI